MHTKMGVANGLTREEIQEIYYTAIPYCGLPKSNGAKAAMARRWAWSGGRPSRAAPVPPRTPSSVFGLSGVMEMETSAMVPP